MNTKLVNSAAGVILAALTQNRTAAGIALALESAQLLMTPEVAAERERLQLRVDEVERAYTFDTAELKRERDALRARVAELEQRDAEAPVAVALTAQAAESADKLTALFAPTQALREDEAARPGFFQPGHTYAARVGWPGGRERFRFLCESVTTDLETGKPRAIGQHGRRRTADGEWIWVPNPRTYDDWRGGAWTDITESGGAA